VRILFVNDYGYRLGGAETSALAQAESLRKMGFDVRWLTSNSRGGGTLQRAGESELFHRDYFCRGTSSDRRILRALRQWANFSARFALRAAISEWRPNLVHVHGYLGQLSPAILGELKRVPAVATLHTYKAICPKGTLHYRDTSTCVNSFSRDCHRSGCLSAIHAWHERIKQMTWGDPFRNFDRLIAPSTFVKEVFGRRTSLPIDVIPHSARSARLPSGNREEKHFLYAGRLHPQKGVDVLIRAFKQAEIAGARLTIAGDGPARADLVALTQKLGVGNVVFTGHLSTRDLESYYSRCGTVVVPSLWPETSGLVVGEALAHGARVIASSVGALVEWTHGENVSWVAPGDGPELAIALCLAVNLKPSEPAAAFDGQKLLIDCYRKASDQTMKEKLTAGGFDGVPTSPETVAS